MTNGTYTVKTTLCCRYEEREEKIVIRLFLKVLVTISMEDSWRDLSIDMVLDRFILKDNQIMLSPCITFIPKTGVGLPKTRGKFLPRMCS